MSHFALLWKARTIEKYRQNYENEKINSIIKSNAEIPDKTLFQKWRHYSHNLQNRLSRTFSKWYPEGTTVSNFYVSLRSDYNMRLPNILLRSLYGFVGGLLLTYLGFMFFVFQLSLSVIHATILSSILGILLTLGLTFSNRMRCLIFLLVPQLFSRVGRYTLTCYALVLILTGPATNTLKNSEVLSESMACSQEQIKTNIRQINESVEKPFNSIHESLKITMHKMKVVVAKLKAAIIRINRLILSLASITQASFSWLESVATNCNNVLGEPEDTCIKAIRDKLADNKPLKDQINKKDKDTCICPVIGKKRPFKMLRQDCNEYCKESMAKIVCNTLYKYDKYCVAADFVEASFLGTIKRRLKSFTNKLHRLLHMKLNIHHSYVFIGSSETNNQIAAGIVTEIRNRADPILTWLSWSSCVTSLFLLLIIFRAKHYQHMFETSSRFDNRFITKEFRELDLKRLRERRETVLPLNRRERAKYVTTTSFRLVASEKIHLNRSAIFMTVTTFKLLIHIVADYSLYWVLMTIRHHGKLQAPLHASLPESGAFMSGTGFVSRLLQAFIDSLNVHLSFPPPDNTCLPNPYPPDFKRYCQIGFLIFLLWFFAIFEPYGLRIRHIIMGHYRPERAKTRAVWLYNHMLRTRGSFMKFARRRLHREYKYTSQSNLTLSKWLQSIIPFACLRTLLGLKREYPHCLLCNITERSSDERTELIKCQVPKCPGTYCKSCFSDIGELCTICLSPSDYGDLSDISLERDSSSESGDSDSSDENDDDDDDDDFDDYHPGGHRRGNVTYRSNTFDDNTSKGSKFGKEMRLLTLLEKKRGKGRYMSPLSHRHDAKIDATNNESSTIQIVSAKINNPHIFKELEFIENFMKKKDINKRCNIIKDANNNNVTLVLQETFDFLQNNAFKIEPTKKLLVMRTSHNVTLLAKYLRKKGIIRCRKQKMMKKRIKKNTNVNINRNRKKRKQHVINKMKQVQRNDVQFFMTCCSARNDANGGVQIKKDDCLKENEKINDENQDVGEPPSKSNPEDENEKQTSSKEKIKSNNSLTCVCIQKFQTILARYWRTQSSQKINTEIKQNLPPLPEKKHKRKKKKTESKDSSENKFKHLKDLKKSSRLFAYLDDWDWMQSHFTSHKQVNVKKKSGASMKSALNKNKRDKEGKGDSSPEHAEVEIVNNIRIPHLDLKQITGSGNDEENSLKVETTARESDSKETNYAWGALDRFFHSINIKGLHSKRNIHVSRSNVKQKSKRITVEKPSEIKDNGCILKRYLSRSSGFSLSRPLSLLRNIYSSLLMRLNYGDTNVIEEDIILKTVLRTDDKEVSVHPQMCSCACQYDLTSNRDTTKTACNDCSTQDNLITADVKPILVDAKTGSEKPLCTCATQYQGANARAVTYNRRSSDSDIAILNRSQSISSETSQSDTTDTTVCTYCVKCRTRSYKYTQSPIIVKHQKSTTTEKVNCDVSTATDWWSPISDRKDLKKYDTDRKDSNKYEVKIKNMKHEQDRNKCEIDRKEIKYAIDSKEIKYETDRKDLKKYEKDRKDRKYTHFKKQDVEMVRNETVNVSSARRIVTFKSSDQIIPRDTRFDDLLSPSRYLLESQWYYNELFCSSFNRSPHSTHKRQPTSDRYRYVGHHQNRTNRGRKTKRLEEIYTCATRKHCSPRKRGNDFFDSPHKSRRHK